MKSVIGPGCSLSTLLFKIVFDILAGTNKAKEKKIKEIQTGKEEAKPFLFVDDIMLYIKEPQNSTSN